jgi:hypothetical protein
MPWGERTSLMPFLSPWTASYIAPPMTGVRESAALPKSRTFS